MNGFDSREDEVLDKCVSALSKFFPNVLILASRQDFENSQNTVSVHKSHGNIYDNIGFAREWVSRNNTETHEAVRKDAGV